MVILLFELLRSPECLTDGSWLCSIPLQTDEQRSSTKQSLEEKKGRRKTGERKCCGVENVNYKNRTTKQKPSEEGQEAQRLKKKPVNLKSYKHLSKFMRVRIWNIKINITSFHLLLLKNYMKETFWQASRQSKCIPQLSFL